MKLNQILNKRYESVILDRVLDFIKNLLENFIIYALLTFAIKLFLIINFLSSIFTISYFSVAFYLGDFIENFYYLTLFTLFLIPIVDVPLFSLVYLHNSKKERTVKNWLLAFIAGLIGGVLVIFLTIVVLYLLVQLLLSGYLKTSYQLTK